MPLILMLARIGLGVTLVLAGISKATGRLKFEQSLYNFGLVPVAAVRPMSFVIPATELTLGVILIIGLFARWAAIAAGFLIAAFSVGIVLNLVENRRVECGCFGGFGDGPISGWTLLRNSGLVVVAILISIWGAGAFAL